MPVKVLDDSGTGNSASIADGIRYAVDNGAKVINMSLGFKAYSGITNDEFIDEQLDYANINGVTVVCAAGNDAGDELYSAGISYPAIYPTTIAVGATGYNNERVAYSNYGSELTVMAPGGDLLADFFMPGDGYTDGVLQETLYEGLSGIPGLA